MHAQGWLFLSHLKFRTSSAYQTPTNHCARLIKITAPSVTSALCNFTEALRCSNFKIWTVEYDMVASTFSITLINMLVCLCTMTKSNLLIIQHVSHSQSCRIVAQVLWHINQTPVSHRGVMSMRAAPGRMVGYERKGRRRTPETFCD